MRYYIFNWLLGLQPKQSATKEIRVYGVKQVNDLAETTLTGRGVAFVHSTSAADTVTDTGTGFVTAGFKAGDYFRAEGTALNDGVAWRIASVVAGTLTLHKSEIVTTESAGTSFTLTTVTPIPEMGQHAVISKAALRLAKSYPFLSERVNAMADIYGDDLAELRSIVPLQEGNVTVGPGDYN